MRSDHVVQRVSIVLQLQITHGSHCIATLSQDLKKKPYLNCSLSVFFDRIKLCFVVLTYTLRATRSELAVESVFSQSHGISKQCFFSIWLIEQKCFFYHIIDIRDVPARPGPTLPDAFMTDYFLVSSIDIILNM